MFNDIAISDGHIYQINIDLNEVKLFILTYKEEKYEIVFDEVIAIKSFDPIKEDLSHATFSKESNFIEETKIVIENEDDEKLVSYGFYSAWTNEIILEIISTSCFTVNHLS